MTSPGMLGPDDAVDDAGLEPSASIFDDIFALTEPTLRRPLRRKFMPWHKPRKQFVRREQWGPEIEWLLSQRPDSDAPLRYLGLPGADLLDIRYFHRRFCGPPGRKFTFLGFDESAQPESPNRDALNISLQEVRALPHVDQRSDVIFDNFRGLANRDSIAWDRATSLGPFDIINIDLCGGFAEDEPSVDQSIYDAVYQLGGLQSRQLRPWAVFLTSRVEPSKFSPNALQKLLGLLQSSAGQCEEFAQECADRFGEIAFTPADVPTWHQERFFNVAATGLSVWFLTLATTMSCKLSIASSAAYRIWGGAQHFDMVSLVARFEPVPQIGKDPSGLSKAASDTLDECAQAVEIPRAISATVDVDGCLNGNDELRNQLTDEMAALLSSARYDPDEYRVWAAQQPYRQAAISPGSTGE